MANNYTIGRGRLYFRPLGSPNGFGYFGNTTKFNLAVENEDLKHFSSDEGLKEQDDAITLQRNYRGAFTTDNLSGENVAFWFASEVGASAQSAATGETQTFEDVTGGQLLRLAHNDVTINTVTGLTEGEYTVDAKRGNIKVKDSVSPVASVSVTYDAAASTVERIISGADEIEGELYFEATNPKGDLRDATIARVKISPDGEFNLKSDEWTEINFNIEAFKVEGRPTIEFSGVPA